VHVYGLNRTLNGPITVGPVKGESEQRLTDRAAGGSGWRGHGAGLNSVGGKPRPVVDDDMGRRSAERRDEGEVVNGAANKLMSGAFRGRGRRTEGAFRRRLGCQLRRFSAGVGIQTGKTSELPRNRAGHHQSFGCGREHLEHRGRARRFAGPSSRLRKLPVIGIPHERGGERPKAFSHAENEGASRERRRDHSAFLSRPLAHYKCRGTRSS